MAEIVSFEFPMIILTLMLIAIGLYILMQKKNFLEAPKYWHMIITGFVLAVLIALLPLLRIITFALPFLLLLFVVYGFVFFTLYLFKDPWQLLEMKNFRKMFYFSMTAVFLIVAFMSASHFLGQSFLDLTSPTGAASRSPAAEFFFSPNVLYLLMFLIVGVFLYRAVVRTANHS